MKCTAHQHNLGKKAYENKVPINTYINGVEILPVGYVDDVLTISKCGNNPVIANSIANVFTNQKKIEV